MDKKGKLELTWVGKYEEEKLEPRILIEDKSKSYGESNTENMLIHGDNLLALKALENKYTGMIKCIYIDPPYNTGAAFEHYDDNLEHSIWLGIMKKRLEILRNLLAEDGTIWIQIDDEEQAYLKVLCDEIFGRSNFVNMISVNMKNVAGASGGGEDKRLKKNCEYILVYAKNYDLLTDNYIYQNKKEDKDKELIETLQNITDIFLSLLSVIDSIKFHSSDYLDALEMDMEPQEGSQYWVCPIIVEYMNDRFDKKLLQYIQDNEENGMRFMAEYYAD